MGNDPLIKIVAAQMVVSVCRQYLDHITADLDNGHIKRTATQIVHQDLLGSPVVQSVCQSCASGLVDDPFHIQSGNAPRILGCLPLYIIKISRHCDHSIVHRFSQVILRILFQFAQDHGTDLLRSVPLSVYGFGPVRPHLSFNGTDGPVAVYGSLPLGSFSDQLLS